MERLESSSYRYLYHNIISSVLYAVMVVNKQVGPEFPIVQTLNGST